MDISLYITELLRDYDSIGLIGIGTFNKKKTPARFDRVNGIVYPPIEVLSFKPVIENETILLNYISRIKNISEASAKYFVNKYAESIHEHLETDGVFNIPAIGTLKVANGSLYMEPLVSTPHTFGMVAEKDPAHISRIQTVGTNPVLAAADTSSSGQEPLTEGLDYPQEKSGGSFWNVFGSILFLIAIAAGLTYIFNPEFFGLESDLPLNKRREQLATKRQPKPAIPVADTVAKADSVSSSSSLESPSVDPATPAPQKRTPSYEVIGASFALREEAEKYITHLKGKGIKASIIEDSRKPKYKVSLGGSSDPGEAGKIKRHIQENFNKEAWVLTVNDKAKQ